MSRERVLILTLSFGAGHVRAAEVIRSEFVRQRPNAEAKLVDILANCSFLFKLFYVRPYWLMIRFAPRVWRWFFLARKNRNDEYTAPGWAWRWGCKKGFTELQDFDPDLIVCCEVGASDMAVISKRRGLTSARIISVITDLEAEPIWVKPEIESYAVPDETVSRQLQEWGAPSDRIRACGLPIDPHFGVAIDREKTRQQFGFGPRPLILLMGGGMGPTHMDEVASSLLKSGESIQIVALPGQDKRTRRRLEKIARQFPEDLIVFGWSNEVPELMRAADILVTKPGGVTLAEAAACSLPMVLFDAIPGPEESNAERFVKTGAAVLADGAADAAGRTLEVLNNERQLKTMAAEAGGVAHPTAAEDIVRLALGERAGVPAEKQLQTGAPV